MTEQRISPTGGNTPSHALAKINRPTVERVYNRTRLFRLLDRARKSPVVWISAPAGAGKTTLIASYLQAHRVPALWYRMDAGDDDIAAFFYYMGRAAKNAAPQHRMSLPLFTQEYLTGLSAFTANYFRELFRRLRRPSVVVLDNYQDTAKDGALQNLLQQGFDQIPPDINVIVLSRESPPGAFARLRAGDHIALLGWQELKLTEQENTGIAKLRQKNSTLARARLAELHRQTQGWAAGLVLLMEGTERSAGEYSHPPELATQSVFDYFAYEIFRYEPLHTQVFLLKTVFLPKFSAATAQTLAGDERAGAILRDLCKRNYFTVRDTEGNFEYHPLFRAFLINRISETWTAQETRELRQRSAALAAKNSDVETAVALLEEAEDWSSAMRIMFEQAPLLVSQGRTQTVETWLKKVPNAVRETNPWALYWLSVCRLAFSPKEARQCLEQAFALFEKEADASPLYLTWSLIIESFVLEGRDFTPMIKWLDRYHFLSTGRTPPLTNIEAASVFAYVSGLLHARADHPDLTAYAERAELLLSHETNVDRRFKRVTILMAYHMWRGNVAQMRYLLETLAPHADVQNVRPLTRISWSVCNAIYMCGGILAEESLRAVTDGLALAKSSGIHLLDHQLLGYGIWGQTVAGNLAMARTLLNCMSSFLGRRLNSDVFYRYYASIVYLHEGDTTRALEEARQSYQLAITNSLSIGLLPSLLCLAFALARQGDTDAALTAINETKAVARSMHSKLFLSFSAFGEAHIRRLRGEQALSLQALHESLSLGQELVHMAPAPCLRQDAAQLYATALDAGIYPDYVRNVISNMRLPPPTGQLLEKWPWPIRVYTLGNFAIVKENQSIAFTGKAKKTIELLRALIVSGGGKGVSIKKLAQMLWPEADGDMAEHTLETTLYRLRKLIGEKSILLKGRQISINPECCWLDVWAFEQLSEQLSDRADLIANAMVNAKRLLELYKGAFLEEDELPATTIRRERLHSKFLRAVMQLGEALEHKSDHEAAVALYHQAIDIEPSTEEFYARLMRCLYELNRSAEAIAVYQRGRTALKLLLNAEPAVEIRTLYAEIQRQIS